MRSTLYFMLLLKFTIAVLRAEDTGRNDIYSDENKSLDENISWNGFMIKARWATSQFMTYFHPHLKSSLSSGNVSEPCAKSLFSYFEGLKKWEPWAIKMADATGKIPSGLMTGTRTDFGAFDECLQVKVKAKDEVFKGQFCMVMFQSPLVYPMDLKTPNGKSYIEDYGHPPEWIKDMMEGQRILLKESSICIGTCLPSTCTAEDVFHFFSSVFKPWTSKVIVSDCQDDEPRKWPTSAFIAICILLTLSGVCLLGTVMDLQDKSRLNETNEENSSINEGLCRKLLKSFSLPANSAKVFEKRSRKSSFDCLNGIRFILSLWVILSHLTVYPERFKEWKHTSFQNGLNIFGIVTIALENAFLNMENFSVISGFLMVYTMKRKLEKNGGKLDFIEFIIRRYWRLMPPFLLLLVIFFAVPVMSSGPIWNSSWDFELGKCRNSWWWNILLIQNFLHINDSCATHTWYIGSLMQVQIAGALLMLVTFRAPRGGIVMGFLMVIGCISIDYTTAKSNEFLMTDVQQLRDFDMLRDWVSKIYFRPFNHFPSFVCGMILGWIILTYKDIALPKMFRVVCWIASIMFYAMAMYGIWLPTRNFHIIALYFALRTLCWGLSTSWVLFSLFTGQQENIVNRFFSMEALIPLSRISYCTYIFHPIVLLYREAERRERMYMGLLDLGFESLAIIVISTGLAYVGHIALELPFTSIYDLLHNQQCSKLAKTTVATKDEVNVVAENYSSVERNGVCSYVNKIKSH